MPSTIPPNVAWSVRAFASAILFLLLSAGGLTSHSYAAGISDDDNVEVKAEATRAVDAAPGEVVSTVFRVRNTSDSLRSYTPSVRLPNGWLLVSSRSSFSVAPGAAVQRVVSFRIPNGSEPGNFEVEYRVLDETNPFRLAKDVMRVAIASVERLDLQLMDTPDFVLAGEEYEARFLLINAGNSRFLGTVRARSVPDFPYTIDGDVVDVVANGSVPVSITISTRSLGVRRFQHWIKIDIVDRNGQVVASNNVSIDVLPAGIRGTRAGAIPASIKLIGFDSYRGRGGQLEIAARGSLREESKNIVDVFVRTPDHSSTSLFARRDEYSVAFATEYVAVQLGDYTYGLSPLTEFGRSGRGIGLQGFSGPMSLGVYAARNRNSFPKEDIIGVTLGYDLSERVQFSANFIDKSGQFDGQTISIRTQFEPVRNSFIDIEIGDGGSGLAQSNGVSASASGRYDLVSYDLRHLAAGSGFPGLYQDYSNTSGTIQVRPTDQLSVSTSYQISDRIYDGPVAQTVETISKYLTVGPQYDYKFGEHLLTSSVKYAYRAQNTVAGGTWVTRNEQQARFRTNLSMRIGGFESLSFGGLADIGRVNSGFLAESIGGWRYGANARASAGRLSSSIYFERTIGATLNRVTDNRSVNLGASIDFDLNQRTEIGLNAFTIRDNSAYGVRYSLLATTVQHRFPFGHTAGLQTNISTFAYAGGSMLGDVSFSYEIPLGIPTLRASAVLLRGRVVDFETGEPIDGVVLRLGSDRVVTNDRGEFKFRWDSETTQYLFLDQTSVGLDRVPMVTMPMPITEQSLLSVVEVPVARAGELFGVFQRFEYSDGARQEGELVPVDVERYAVIEATDDVGSYRTTTDEQGRFSFRNLRPGQWAVRVVFANLPDGFRTESTTRKHPMAPGERVEIQLRTKPRKRAIKFVSGGRVTIGSPGLVPPNTKADSVDFEENGVGNVGTDRTRADSTGGRLDDAEERPDGTDSTNMSTASQSDSAATSNGVSTHRDAQLSPHGDSLQVNGRNPSADEFVANRIRRAFEEALRVASDLDPDYVWQDRYVVVDSTEIEDCMPEPNEGQHKIARGESLVFVARKYYCDPVMWPKIWFANYLAVPNPNLVTVGQRLVVPTKEGDVYGFSYQPERDRIAKPVNWEIQPVSVTNIYPVRADDTLYGIARRTMGNGFLWPRIWMVNRGLVGEDTELIDGMELIIPGRDRLREEARVLFGVR